MECSHVLIRKLSNGRCMLCDSPQIDVDSEIAALDELELAAQQELLQLDADAARLDLCEFVRQAWPTIESVPLEWNWHHEALCRNIQGMLDEWLKRKSDWRYEMRWHKMIVNLCPASLKSRIFMTMAPAWMWLHAPDFEWFCLSANLRNVKAESNTCRELVSSKWYRDTFNIQWTIHPRIDACLKWATTAGGLRITSGTAATITGFHVNGILIDDPDDAYAVHSEAERIARQGKISALSSRLRDKRHFVMLSLQQRVHVDDHTGEQLARGDSLHANYALQYNDRTRADTPFFTDPRSIPGEILQPVRFTPAVVASAKLELGAHGFESQYNGNPSPLEGGMIARAGFRFFRIAGTPIGPCARPNGCNSDEPYIVQRLDNGELDLDWVTITVDATFGSLSATADSVGLLVVGGKGVKRFILDDITKPRSFAGTKDAIRDMMRSYPATTRILVEKKANGAAIIEDLQLEFAGLIAIEPEGGKESRAYAMTPAIDSGTVYLLDGAHWVDEFINEVCLFPNAKHDDRVDALSQLMNYFRESLDVQKILAKADAFKKMAASPQLRMLMRR